MSLRIVYRMRHRNMPKASGIGSGPLGRITRLRKLVTALVRHERIEGLHFYLDETRGYVELLIMNAIKYGDKHKHTMEMADYWLLEKDLVHKLFKVLAPRYQNYSTSFTKLWRLPNEYPSIELSVGLLELKGNPWPPVVQKERDYSKSLTNVLLREAQKEYTARKATTKNHTDLLPPKKIVKTSPYDSQSNRDKEYAQELAKLKLSDDVGRKNRDEGTPV